MQDNKNSENLFEDALDIKRYIRVLFLNIYIIIGFLLAGALSWYLYISNAPKIYDVKSLLQFQDGANGSVTNYEDLLFGSSSNILIDEQIRIYKSYSNLKSLVNQLELNIIVNGIYQTKSQKPIAFNFLDSNLKIDEDYSLIYINGNENFFDIYDSGKNLIASNLPYQEEHNFDNLLIDIDNIKSSFYGLDIPVIHQNVSKTVDFLKSSLLLSKAINSRTFYFQQSLISITFASDNIELAKLIIDGSNDIFINNSIKSNVEKAAQSLTFIDDQVSLINQALEQSQKELNSFRSKNISIDIDKEAESILEELSIQKDAVMRMNLDLADLMQKYKPSNPLIKSLESQNLY